MKLFYECMVGVKGQRRNIYLNFHQMSRMKRKLYHYYAELSRIAKKAFPDCNDGQRRKFIDERFMSGLFNDALRTKLMETYKYGNFFSKMFRADQSWNVH